MAFYLNKRDQVPGWEVASVMLFIMFCEIFYLLTWATVGFTVSSATLPEVFGLIPFIALGGVVVFAVWLLYFRGRLFAASQLRNRKIVHAFKMATFKHYVLFFLLRSPALLAAVFVYTTALTLFGVEGVLPLTLGILARHLLRGDHTHTDASGGDYLLGHSVSRERRANGRVWVCAAQLFHLVQRADRSGVLAPRSTRTAWPVMAHALTTVRLLLAVPVTVAFARPEFVSPSALVVLLGVAIATDYWDGRVARMTETASAKGQLFDHGTDFVFVTAALAGAATAGLVTPVLPILIVIAFGQYVLDSYLLHRQKQLRMNALGRWNGILYFVPLLVVSVSRLGVARDLASFLTFAARVFSYALVASTVVSVVDRARASTRNHRESRRLNEGSLTDAVMCKCAKRLRRLQPACVARPRES